MDRDLLGHLPIVIAVARHRAFAAAATELRMSPSAVSNAVRSVEDRLGIPLFARTTRSVSLTEAGARFVAGVAPALTDIGQTVDGLTAERGAVTGLLRIDSPLYAFEMALPQILAKLAQEHPRLTVEIRTGQTHVDIVAEGFDAGIRNRRWIHQDMVTVPLTGPYRNILVASANYLAARGAPKSIVELHQHNCIGFHGSASGRIYGGDEFGFGGRRYCLCCGTTGAPVPQRRQSQMVAAPYGDRIWWIVSLLSAACVPCAEASRLY
jgi:DNA-binding transcriptional LysR family regulator